MDVLWNVADIALGMLLRSGMVYRLRSVSWDTEQGQFLNQPGAFWRPRQFSDETAHEIDVAVRGRLEGALARAVGILTVNRAELDEGALALLAHESLTAEELPRVKAEKVGAAG
jgi:cell division protease FtsH